MMLVGDVGKRCEWMQLLEEIRGREKISYERVSVIKREEPLKVQAQEPMKTSYVFTYQNVSRQPSLIVEPPPPTVRIESVVRADPRPAITLGPRKTEVQPLAHPPCRTSQRPIEATFNYPQSERSVDPKEFNITTNTKSFHSS
jgi:hypothetical protein